MNFFDAQDSARRASRWLVIAYLFATLLIVAGVTAVVAFALFTVTEPMNGTGDYIADRGPLLLATAIITALFIFAASLIRSSMLSGGGGRVAKQMGGTLIAADVSDPLRQRLRNVVEEMAIASGVPVPEIYVLEEESAINAFAAGHAPGDAAIAVTRGTLELLDRDELQGVIAHEFSHILNGDMRLNIRLMGVLFGILVIGLIGRIVLRGGYHANIVSSRRGRGAPVILMVGAGLAVLGAIGVFFARLIKAAVSRQRELLADASAVQFTRQNTGIANALKKIGGYTEASYLTATDPEEVSHMLFGSGSRLFGLFATHPPLAARIRAIDPSFDEKDYPRVDSRAMRRDDAYGTAASGISSMAAAMAAGGRVMSPESISETVGNPDPEHIEYAQRLRHAIPGELYDAAHSPESSYLLALALILDRSGSALSSQLKLVEGQLGADRTRMIRRYYDSLQATGAEFRLPLQEISFPALKLRPAPQLSFLVETAARLIEIDGEIDLYEFCFYRILTTSLREATNPRGGIPRRRVQKRELRQAALNLLALVADHGDQSAPHHEAAYRAGAAVLGSWATESEFRPRRDLPVQVLDQSLDILRTRDSRTRQRLLDAVTTTAAHDHHLTVSEAEMLRAICASLDCPLPPILVQLPAM